MATSMNGIIQELEEMFQTTFREAKIWRVFDLPNEENPCRLRLKPGSMLFAGKDWNEVTNRAIRYLTDVYGDPVAKPQSPGMATFDRLVAEAKVRAQAAMTKYPQPNYVALKFGEESGEVTKEIVHYTEGRGNWDFVEYEMTDVLAMMIRLLVEGDGVIGFKPPYLQESKDNG